MNSYLYHHGILGQKWGKRNGPPYPLDYEDHSASEKKAGFRKSISNPDTESNSKSNRIRLTEKQKKMIAIGSAVALAGLATYGAYKVGLIGKHTIKGAINGIDVTGVERIGIERIPTQIVEPELMTLKNVNGHLMGTPENQYSCPSCSIAGFLRTEGWNTRSLNFKGTLANNASEFESLLKNCFEGAKIKFPTNASSFVKDPDGWLVRQMGENAKGVLSFTFAPGSSFASRENAGHAINFEIVNGVVEFSDFKIARDDSFIRTFVLDAIAPNGEFLAADLSSANPVWSELSKIIDIR